MSKSMVEEFEARAAKIDELILERDAFAAERDAIAMERDDLSEKVAILESEKDQMAQQHVEEKGQMQEIFEANRVQIEEQSESIKELEEAVEGLEGQLALSPFSDISEGDEPVAEDGGEGEGHVDHKAEMEKLHGADAIAYYREHQSAIDSAFKK